MSIRIADPGDPRVRVFTDLKDAVLRRQVEDGQGIFIVEGVTAIRQVLASDHDVVSIYATPAKLAQLDLGHEHELPVYVAEPEVLCRTVGFDLHRGAVAAARRRERGIEEVIEHGELFLGLEGLNDHENIGAIFRSAWALGADGVVLDPRCADPYYRRSVRVSMGAVATLPFARSVRWQEDLEHIRSRRIEIVALTPDGHAALLEERPGRRVLLLVGAEGPGLRPETLARADHQMRIPMRPGVDSLNVGHAAAIAISRLRVMKPDRPSATGPE